MTHVSRESARLFEAAEIRRWETDTLCEAAQWISSPLDPELAFRLIVEQPATVTRFESASIQLLRDGYLEIVGGQS